MVLFLSSRGQERSFREETDEESFCVLNIPLLGAYKSSSSPAEIDIYFILQVASFLQGKKRWFPNRRWIDIRPYGQHHSKILASHRFYTQLNLHPGEARA